MDTKLFRDSIVSEDRKEFSDNGATLRTEILAGYGLHKDKFGCSQLGELVIRPQHNKIVLSGLVYFLEQAFGIKSGVKIRNLNQICNIGLGNSTPVETSRVCLFNVGLEGCGASYADVKTVLDQQNIVSNTMIPFRVVDTNTVVADPARGDDGPYWFKVSNTTDVNGTPITKDWYLMKQFEVNDRNGTPDVQLVSRWRDAEFGKDGTLVTDNPETVDRTDGIETYVEMVMRISATDLREYFEIYKDSSQARFNSIGLCSGIKARFEDGSYEYTDVRQITVLNFSNEMLHFEKDLSIIYRIYLS